MKDDDNSISNLVMFNGNAISILQAVFNYPEEPAPAECVSKKASMKFMLTMQDEKDLQNLGYSQAQINNIKPQEAEDILKANKV